MEIARQLATDAAAAHRVVPHNDVGDLTPVEWLVYLDDHANRELRRVHGHDDGRGARST